MRHIQFLPNFHARLNFPKSSLSGDAQLNLVLLQSLSKDKHVYLQVPKDLKQRIEDYFQTSWSVSNGIDINEVRVPATGYRFVPLMHGCRARSILWQICSRRVLCVTRSARGYIVS
jgi:hypothetical protein